MDNVSKFSVLMTVYKSDNPNYFKISLNSILNQTAFPTEIVIVKDGQVPQTIQNVINEVDSLYPDIIRQVQLKTNVGLGLALNVGLKECRYELVARMDSDDICLPERFEKQLAIFSKYPETDIVGCPVKEFVGTPDNIVGKEMFLLAILRFINMLEEEIHLIIQLLCIERVR